MLDFEVKTKVINRLSRVEGQVRGIAKMVEEDRYCIDILNQLAAIKAALAKVESRLLGNHLEHCIEGAIIAGDKKEQRKKVAELIELLERAK